MKLPKKLMRQGLTDPASPAAPVIPLARSVAEEHVYMDMSPCGCGDSAFDRNSFSLVDIGGQFATRFSGDCSGCGALREFVFRLPEEPLRPRPGEVVFGSGDRSELLDAGQWFLVAIRNADVADLLAQTADSAKMAALSPEEIRVRRHQLMTAEAAIGEVLAFVPPGAAAVPYTALWSDLGRNMYNHEPSFFNRGRLETVRDIYRGILTKMNQLG